MSFEITLMIQIEVGNNEPPYIRCNYNIMVSHIHFDFI